RKLDWQSAPVILSRLTRPSRRRRRCEECEPLSVSVAFRATEHEMDQWTVFRASEYIAVVTNHPRRVAFGGHDVLPANDHRNCSPVGKWKVGQRDASDRELILDVERQQLAVERLHRLDLEDGGR